jgi:endoglucanase
LGNTLDSHSLGQGGETDWGNPRINQELMNGVKAAGFDIIRIPITWMGFIGPAPDHKITTSRLKRVADVVNMAHNAGLKAIINLHHDGAVENTNSATGWLSVAKATRNPDEYARISTQFALVWKQIAIYFRNYGDWLIFEAFNELHDGNWGSGNVFTQLLTINKWNQLFTDTVRSTGGNNETRYLMICAYSNDRRQALSAAFMLPNDSAQDRLIVSFHYYDPYEFGIAGSRYTWGSEQDKQKVEDDFSPFKEKYIDKNVPVIIGECGAVLQLYPDDQAKETQARQSRLEYVPYIYATAKKHGLVPVYWDNGSTRGSGEKFGLLNRSNGQPNSPESEAIIKSMIEAVK